MTYSVEISDGCIDLLASLSKRAQSLLTWRLQHLAHVAEEELSPHWQKAEAPMFNIRLGIHYGLICSVDPRERVLTVLKVQARRLDA